MSAPANPYLHEVVITTIIVRDGKYLITRRAATKRRFPGMWTVPGGRLETSDYLHLPKQTEFYWYNILEQVAKREIAEEVGLEITNIRYVTSLATVHADGSPSLVISCIADYLSGEVKLQLEETDAAEWVSLEEARNYALIDGIYNELMMAERVRLGQAVGEWQRQ